MRTALQLLIANDVAEQKSMVYDLFIFYWKYACILANCTWLLIHWNKLLLFCLGTSSLAIIDGNDVLIGCFVFCVLVSCLKQGHITGMY